MEKGLIIFLHGVGSQGSDFTDLAQTWQHLWLDISFSYPNAPHPFSGGPGFEWFSIAGVTQENRGERIKAARASFDACIKKIMADKGFTDHPERVVLAGFSQGAIMALDTLVSNRSHFAGIVSFSGRLVLPENPEYSLNTPVCLIHGTADKVIPAQESQQAQQVFKTAGLTSDFYPISGQGHYLSPEGVGAAQDFIAALVNQF